MAEEVDETLLNVPDSDEDDGVDFGRYYFKEWSAIEALYNLSIHNENNEDEDFSASESSQDGNELNKTTSDDDDEDDVVDDDEEDINQLDSDLDDAMVISKPRNDNYWVWKPEEFYDVSFEASSSEDEI